jgi:hypothetical protein
MKYFQIFHTGRKRHVKTPCRTDSEFSVRNRFSHAALCVAAVGPAAIDKGEEEAQDNAAVLYLLTIECRTSLQIASAVGIPSTHANT